MLTLAARTEIEMQNEYVASAYRDVDTGVDVFFDGDEYVSDCAFVEIIIRKHYNLHMSRAQNATSTSPSKQHSFLSHTPAPTPTNANANEDPELQQTRPNPSDNSPNLVQIFYDVLDELVKVGRPRGKWLRWDTAIGYLLFGMLVSIKMKAFVEEWKSEVVGTLGWRQFEDGRRALQERILGEVRGDGL